MGVGYHPVGAARRAAETLGGRAIGGGGLPAPQFGGAAVVVADRSRRCLADVQADRKQVHQAAVALLALAQGLLNLNAAADLVFKRLGLLLQTGNGAKAFFAAGQRGVALGRKNAGVLVANLTEKIAAGLSPKMLHGIGAEEGERMLFRKLVPEGFQAEGGGLLAARPQQRHHFAKRTHSTAALGHAPDYAADHLGKSKRVGRPVNHELR